MTLQNELDLQPPAEETPRTTPYDYPIVETHRLDGVGKQAFEVGRNRLIVAATVLSFAFVAVGYRLVDLTLLTGREEARIASHADSPAPAHVRADVVDRNGVLLATSLPTPSLYADPTAVLDVKEAAEKLVRVLPDMNRLTLETKLAAKGRFVWLRRNLSPQQQFDIHRLGLPGIGFEMESRRVYPQGRLAAHVLGTTDTDGRGIAGIEKSFDQALRDTGKPLALSLDVRLQAVMRQELMRAMAKFSAIGAAGLMKDVHTGEVVAMVSLPDFDANDKTALSGDAGFNRVTKGVYELGSSFKLFTAAMALDSGTVAWDGGYDATDPIRVARFTINDYHGKKRWLSVPEIIVYSSNIGAAKMAVDVGTKGQQRYLANLGLLRPSALELPETGHPLVPRPWREINTMTISFGHGIAVTPLHLATGISALVNGGLFRSATVLRQPVGGAARGVRVITDDTSAKMRRLMRLVVTEGTGRKAAAKGYRVGGKTGTADKQVGGSYREKMLISSFVAAFPMDAPRYVVLAMLDEPKGIKETFNYATGGWVAAPVVKAVVERAAPLLGIAPRPEAVEEKPAAFRKAALRKPRQKRARTTHLTKVAATIGPVAKPARVESPRERIARQARAVLEQAVATR